MINIYNYLNAHGAPPDTVPVDPAAGSRGALPARYHSAARARVSGNPQRARAECHKVKILPAAS